MPLDTETLGLAIAATAAALWAVSSMIWGLAGTTFKPVVLNCLKGLAACVLFAITLLIMGESLVQPLFTVDRWRLLLLGGSGIIGIAIGDTFYFGSLNRIGPRQASLLSLLAAPMVAVLGWWLLDESLSPLGIAGITLTVSGVAWVVLEKKRPPRAGRAVAKGVAGHATTKLAITAGVIFGVLAAVGQAVGAVMNRAALIEGQASELWTALWRVGLATIVLMPFMAVVGVKRPDGSPRISGRIWLLVLVGVLLGTYGGIWMQQAAFASAKAGPAQTMLSTTPIWILPLAFFAGERVTWRAVAGSVIAVAGVAMLFWNAGASDAG